MQPLAIQWRWFTQLDPALPTALITHGASFGGSYTPQINGLVALTLKGRRPLGDDMYFGGTGLGPLDRRVMHWSQPLGRVGWSQDTIDQQDEIVPVDHDVLGITDGIVDPRWFHGVGPDLMRWSRPMGLFLLPGWQAGERMDRDATVTLFVQFPPPLPANYRPDLTVRAWRKGDLSRISEVRLPEWKPGPFTIELPIPEGCGPVQVGWTMNGVNPARAGASADDRDLGLNFGAIGLRYSRPATQWWQGNSGRGR
jgi:hypothetical protein